MRLIQGVCLPLSGIYECRLCAGMWLITVRLIRHAPPQILDVRVGQPVELRVTRRLNEDFVAPPKRPIGTFEGQGHRLGAIVPDVINSSASSSSPHSDSLNGPGMSA